MIRIEHLQKEYPQFSLDCSLEVKPGSITGLIGQNGAGKSTTFKALLGLISFEGSVRVLGQDPRRATSRHREQLGVVLSDSGFSGYLTVRELLPILAGLYREFDRAFFLDQAKALGLPLEKQLKEFSTGMKAKLKVLCALSHRARLLILDEPTAGLDVIARDDVLLLLRTYMEQDPNRAILISSHIAPDLESLCDEVYMIHQGRIVLHTDTDLLLSHYGLLKVSPLQYQELDKAHLLRVTAAPYGCACLTDQLPYYRENYPALVWEPGSIDTVIASMIKGEPL